MENHPIRPRSSSWGLIGMHDGELGQSGKRIGWEVQVYFWHMNEELGKVEVCIVQT